MFPKILVAQSPLRLGMDLRKKSSSEKTTTLQCDAEGKLKHDAIVRTEHSKPSQKGDEHNNGAQKRIIRLVQVIPKFKIHQKIPRVPLSSPAQTTNNSPICKTTVHINENFAKLTESLYLVDRTACETVKTRAQMERHVVQNKQPEQAEQEAKIETTAAKARQGRIVFKKIREDDSASQEACERDQIKHEKNISKSLILFTLDEQHHEYCPEQSR
uniref:SKIP_SNW domain-containing protein n=1 Tax=Onchocerca volvulus TaxID=6282 RepID=A0A8R1XNC1_ONCVO